MGNRIVKSFTENSQTAYTWYVRDAQGNPDYIENGSIAPQQTLNTLYGISSELAELNIDFATNSNICGFSVDFEEQYTALIKWTNPSPSTSYFCLGTYTKAPETGKAGYRFGFNGKENDNDIICKGRCQDYGMRMYRLDLGRFFSVDPIGKRFPYFTPYQYAANTPIVAIDLDGLEAILVSIVPTNNDPMLTHITITGLMSKIEQDNLSETYRYQDSNGNVTSEVTFYFFRLGSFEEFKMNQTNSNGVKLIDRMGAGSFNGTNFVPNPIQDIESGDRSGWITGAHGFQYDINLKFKDDGSQINANDLKSGTLETALQDIDKAKRTLSGEVSFTNTLGDLVTRDLSDYKLIVTGETDGKVSRYKNGCGNKCLANDRAVNLKNKLQSGNNALMNRTETKSVNHSGRDNQNQRKSSILLTR